MKKFFKGLKCIFPLVAALSIQIAVGFIVSIVLTVKFSAQNIGASPEEIQSAVISQYLQIVTQVIFIVHVMTTIIASIWYYFAAGRKMPGNPLRGFSPLTILVMPLLVIGIQTFCYSFLMLLSKAAPNLMEGYAHIIESSGISALTPLTIITTIILAPIGEELLFRGITLKWLEDALGKFWLANILQAIMFGVFHANIVQGLYAAVMGLVFGYVRKKYNSMYAAILLHALVNFFGTVISPLIFHNSELQLGASAAVLVGAFVILILGILLVNKENKIKDYNILPTE